MLSSCDGRGGSNHRIWTWLLNKRTNHGKGSSTGMNAPRSTSTSSNRPWNVQQPPSSTWQAPSMSSPSSNTQVNSASAQQPRQNIDASRAKCFRCNNVGHIARYCKVTKPSLNLFDNLVDEDDDEQDGVHQSKK